MTVSAHDPFRTMAVEVAGKYAEMSGGSAADVGALTAALAGTLSTMSAQAADGATIELAFRPNGHDIEVTVTCGPHTAVIRQPIPAKQG
jgi:hypothetical protein